MSWSLTSTAQEWADGTANHGVQISSQEWLNFGQNSWMEFTSSEGSGAEPRLTVTFVDVLPTPAGDWRYEELAGTRYEYERVVTGDGPHDYDPARVQQVREVSREKVSDGFRYAESKTTYNSDGLPIKINDYGQRGDAGDNTCTSTSYARNTGKWMLSYSTGGQRRAGDDCGSGTLLEKTVVMYDGATSPTAGTVTAGNPTESRVHSSADEYLTTKTTYDGYGRPVSNTDPAGKVSTTAYSPAVGWPTGGVKVTNPLGHAVTAWTSHLHGQVVGIRDADGNDVNIDYDQLGRTLQLWTPEEPRSATGTPAAKVTYTIPYDGGVQQPTAAARTSVSRLRSGTGESAVWLTDHTYVDGWGRPRERQAASPAGGRMVTVTGYDGRGLESAATAVLHNGGAPGSGLLNPALTDAPQWSMPVYDTLGRPVAAVDYSGATELRRTVIKHFGDRTEVQPPTGGRTVTHTDIADRVTKVEEWADGSTHHDTSYAFDLGGRLTKVVDANGNTRTFGYDLLGRRVTSHDPDSGDSESGYDAAGRLAWTKDGKGQKVSYDYDDLGRPTVQWAGEPGSGTKLTERVYDTLAKGQLTSATRYVNGDAYTDTVTGYDRLGRPTGSTLSIPASEGALAGEYTFTAGYNALGIASEIGMPAAGGLPAEKVTSTFSDLGFAKGLTSDLGGGFTYVKDTAYSATGRMTERLYGENGQVRRTLSWDERTGWLSRITTTAKADTSAPRLAQDDHYTYDLSGEITRILDAASAVPGVTDGQSECFTYDGLHRLSAAWTTTGPACGQGTADGKGVDPYSQSYTYDAVGNLATLTDGGQTSTYRYPEAGASVVRPNAVTAIERPGGTDTYTYDDAGQMTGRTVGGRTGTFTWNELGQLDKATIDGQDTSMVYDADGERLIRRAPGGRTILYLGPMELELSAGQVKGTRYYTTADGSTVAMRTGDRGVTWMASGLHGSVQLGIDDATGNVSRERYLPFGARRGGDDLPFTDRGFLGKTEDDSTGLTYLSARYYDPAIARFISTDPLLVLDEPQWANPYSYAGNNPVGLSDPTGLSPAMKEGGGGHPCGGSKTTKKCLEWKKKAAANLVAGSQADADRFLEALLSAGKELVKIIADELGITAGLECFTKGNAGACGETALNLLTSAIGGLVGKLVAKYGAPWKWATLAKKAEEIWDIGARALAALEGWFKAKARLTTAKKALAKANRELEAAEKRKKSGKKDGCNSFVPGTLVLMADGSRKPIEQVEVGDLVLATDPETGRTEAKPVIALITGQGEKDLVQLTVDTDGDRGDATGVVIATDEHPFWVPDLRVWKNAGDLRPGAWLQTGAGTHVQVTAVAAWTATGQRVHNLTIDDVHTYHVGVGAADVLVHNDFCKSRAAIKEGQRRLPKTIDEIDYDHIRSGHVKGGSRVNSGKDLWPDDVTNEEIASVIRQGLNSNPTVVGYDANTGVVKVHVRVNGRKYELLVNANTHTVRSAYPKG
ncbi:RHS repeat-associated core domain-containing protein [Planomonospora corallina]|uniref:RHS repeat-associated core domain-containing protein n=1 Tax=Planomonospora corallina TaxID=1806052 RepID=A0ABV8IAX7_9ACTN